MANANSSLTSVFSAHLSISDDTVFESPTELNRSEIEANRRKYVLIIILSNNELHLKMFTFKTVSLKLYTHHIILRSNRRTRLKRLSYMKPSWTGLPALNEEAVERIRT